MKFSKTLSTCLKCIFISVFFLSSTVCVFAQLKKTAKIEKVKSFTAGSVALNKTSLDGVEVYSVTLPNNSKYHQPIVFFLGNKGEVFDFSACGKNYQLSFSRTLGQKCFKIWEPINTSNDFGRFFKATIDDILEFMKTPQ